MATIRVKTFILLYISAIAHISSLAQARPGKLIYRTNRGESVQVEGGAILVNGRNLYKLEFDDIIYSSKRNRIIENGGSTFLFLEVNGSPNLDRLYVFKISNSKVDSITDAISSDLKDQDGDTYLEFGGSDLTEEHPSKDSMYYIPSRYYEIKNGQILYDSFFTKKMDVKVNGLYMAHPANAHGFCCKVIPKPGKRNKTTFVDPGLKRKDRQPG